MIKVSVVIPVCNVAQYLPACLDSVLEQTLTDIEIICVEDCSSDNSLDILANYAERDNRVRIFQNSVNQGSSASRNTGMAKAQGEYIFFLDADDLIAQDQALEQLYVIAKEDNADQVIGRAFKWNPDTGERTEEDSVSRQTETLRRVTIIQAPLLKSNVVVWNKLLRRELLTQNKIRFDESLFKFEDNDFSCHVHILSKVISYLPLTTYLYRQRVTGDVSKMYMRDKEDAFWFCHTAKNLLSILMKYGTDEHKRIFFSKVNYMLKKSYQTLDQYAPQDADKIKLMQNFAEILCPLSPDTRKLLKPNIQVIIPFLEKKQHLDAWKKHKCKLSVSIKKFTILCCSLPGNIRSYLSRHAYGKA